MEWRFRTRICYITFCLIPLVIRQNQLIMREFKQIFFLFILGGLFAVSCQQSRKSSGKADTSTISPALTSKADTAYFDLQTKMIKDARIQKITLKHDDKYRVHIKLKDHYRKEFEQVTSKSIGKYFAIRYNGSILAPRLPVINTKITEGQFIIEIFKKRQQAYKVLQLILDKDE